MISVQSVCLPSNLLLCLSFIFLEQAQIELFLCLKMCDGSLLPNAVQILQAFSDLVPAYFKAFSSTRPLQGLALLGKLSFFPFLDTLPLWFNVVSQSDLPAPHFCPYKFSTSFQGRPSSDVPPPLLPLLTPPADSLPPSNFPLFDVSLMATSYFYVSFIFLLYFRNHELLRSDFIHSTNPGPGNTLVQETEMALVLMEQSGV